MRLRRARRRHTSRRRRGVSPAPGGSPAARHRRIARRASEVAAGCRRCAAGRPGGREPQPYPISRSAYRPLEESQRPLLSWSKRSARERPRSTAMRGCEQSQRQQQNKRATGEQEIERSEFLSQQSALERAREQAEERANSVQARLQRQQKSKFCLLAEERMAAAPSAPPRASTALVNLLSCLQVRRVVTPLHAARA